MLLYFFAGNWTVKTVISTKPNPERHRAEMHCMGICRRWNDCTEPIRAEPQHAETHGAGSGPALDILQRLI